MILDSAGVGIVFIKKRVLIRCNQRFAQIFGHSGTADLLRSANVSLYPDEASFHALGKDSYPVMTQGLAFKSEVLMKRRDGQLFWAHLTGKLVNPADTAEGSIWIVDDISEQKAAQAQLQAVLSRCKKRLRTNYCKHARTSKFWSNFARWNSAAP